MGVYLYGQQSNFDTMGKVSGYKNDEVMRVINKYNYNQISNVFEIEVSDLQEMIAELKEIKDTENLVERLEDMIKQSINADYFILYLS